MTLKYFAILICYIIISSCGVMCDDDDFASQTYQAMTRQAKFDKIWGKVNEDNNPYGWYSSFTFVQILFYDMKKSFNYYADSMPSGRKKLLHSVGNVGLVEFVAVKDSSNPYTGIFQGCSHVILRLSCAFKPDEGKRTADEAMDNFTPGFGIKFLRDKIHSGNTVAMYGVNGQPSWNFFENDFSNHIAKADGIALSILNYKFSEATKWTTMIGLSDMAKYDQDGNILQDPIIPYKLIFRPTADAKNLFTDYFSQTFTEELKKIPVDMVLYNVLAVAQPDTDPVKIGSLVVKKQFVTSKWGDKELFFRHGLMDDDLKLHPEWTPKDFEKLKDPEFQKEFKKRFGFEHPH